MAVAGVLHKANIEQKKNSSSLFLEIEGMMLCSGSPKKSGITSDYHMLCLQHFHPALKALEGHPEAAPGGCGRTCLTRFLTSLYPSAKFFNYSHSQMDKKRAAPSS